MNKVKKYWLPITIGVIGVIYILRSMRKTPSVLTGDGQVDTTSGGAGSTPSGTTQSEFPLKKGSKGASVKRLQLALGKDKLPKFGADGDFGTETQNAVKAATGKTQVDSLAEIDAIAAKRGIVWSGGQYVPKLLAAPKNDPLGSYYYGQDPFNFGQYNK
jgi:peptidoglycan hydrolase-like protein with peptidoglycan-binding domain